MLWLTRIANRVSHPTHPAYKAVSGYYRDEAIMILRRFYITENVNGAGNDTLQWGISS